MKRLIITGGHLSPALALIDNLPKGIDVLIIGRKYTFEGDANLSFEFKTAQNLSIPFVSITTGRLQRTFTKYTLSSLFKVPIGFIQAFQIVKKYKPDLVVSFGGYVSLPVVLVSKILKIPVIIHEQTLAGGLANRIESLVVQKVCISWETSRKYFPKSKTVLTGNPMRTFTTDKLPFKISQEKIPLLYITGGSTGSHTINAVVMGCLDKLLEHFKIIHQTGDSFEYKDFDVLEKLRKNLDLKLRERYVITKFVEPSDVGSIIQASNLVISRSGMNTVTELLYFGKPALLVPINHEQLGNALFYKNTGLGEILRQEDITSEKLLKLIEKMSGQIDEYKKNSRKAGELIRKDAIKRIIEEMSPFIRK